MEIEQGRLKPDNNQRLMLKGADLFQKDQILNNLLSEISERNPNLTSLELYKLFASRLPKHFSHQAHLQSIRAARSEDPKTAETGRRVFILMNMGKILGVAKPYFSEGNLNDDDLIQAGIEKLLSSLTQKDPDDTLDVGFYIQYLQSKVKNGINEELQNRHWIRNSWRKGESQAVIVGVTEEIFSDYIYGIPDYLLSDVAAGLSEKSGYPIKTCERYLRYKNLFVKSRILMDEEDLTNSASEEELLKKLDKILDTLSMRQGDIIRRGSGIFKGSTVLHQEIADRYGVTRSRISAIVTDFFDSLRGFHLKKEFLPFLDPNKYGYSPKQDAQISFDSFGMEPEDKTGKKDDGKKYEPEIILEYILPSGRQIDDFRLRYRYPTLTVMELGLKFEIRHKLWERNLRTLSDLMAVSVEKLASIFNEGTALMLKGLLSSFLEEDLDKKILAEYEFPDDWGTTGH